MEVASHPPEPALQILRDPATAAAVLDPERRLLLASLREKPDSATGLANRLGDSRQRLNYHLRILEEAGLVELQEERQRGNFKERVLRVAARSFVVDPGIIGEPGARSEEAEDRFSATYLIGLAARAIRDLAGLLEKAGAQRRRLATAAMASEVRLARPADFEAFVEDLSEAVAEVVARHHDEGGCGRPFRIVTGVYLARERSEEET